MNCSRFRFLIQQWFDATLPAQDEKMLMQHLDSCDSCLRFHHQLEQVIQSTPEVPLPDECLPSNIEALAKRVMVEIPQEKPGFMAMVRNFLPFLNNGGNGQPKQSKAPKEKPQKPPKIKAGKEEATTQEDMSVSSNFPHVKRRGQVDEASPAMQRGKKIQADDDALATSTRLKSLQRLQPNNEDPQSMSQQGMSLGSKFGMNVPARDSLHDETPLTFAESIKRKVREDAAEHGEFGEDPGFGSGFDLPPALPQDFNQAQGYANPGFASGEWAGQSIPQPSQPVNPGGFGSVSPQPQGFGNPAPAGQSWGEPAPAQGAAPGWGDPPVPGVGGDSDWKPKQAGEWGAGQAPLWQGSPAAAGEAKEGWGSSWPEEADAGNDWSKKQAQPNQAGDSWGQPPSAAGLDNWGAPAQAAATGADSWGAQPQTQSPANEWGAPKPAGLGGPDTWGAAPANTSQSWGAQPQTQSPGAGASNNWGAPPPVPGANPPADGWGAPSSQNNQTWGAAQPGADSWDAPAKNDDPWATPAATSNDAWGAPVGAPAANTSAPGWGAQPVAANTEPAWNANPSGANQSAAGWGNPAPDWGQAPPDAGWGAQPPQQPAAAGWSAPSQSSEWGAPQVQQAPPQPAQQGWGADAMSQPQPPAWNAQAPSPSSDWGQPAPMAPSANPFAPQNSPPAPPQQAPVAGANPFIQSAPPPTPGGNVQQQQDFDAWSEEGEQIQTGMWQAFTLDEPALGAPKPPSPAMRPQLPRPGAEPAPAEGSLYDIPIQERMKLQQQQQQPQAPQTPPNVNQYDIPIQERVRLQQQQAAGQPAATPADPPGGIPTNSIMDRLNSILGDEITAMASGTGAPSAPPPPPPPVAPTSGGWNQSAPPGWNQPAAVPSQPLAPLPVPTAQPQAPAPQAPAPQNAPAQSDASLYDIPIQERMRLQQQGSAPQPADASSAGGLFKNLDDSAIDKVFGSIGVPPTAPGAVPPVAPARPAPSVPPAPVPPAPVPVAAVPAPAPPVPPAQQQFAAPSPTPPQPAADNGLFKALDDSAIDRIFSSNLGIKDETVQNSARPNVAPAPPPPPAPVAPPAPPVPPVPSAGAPSNVPPVPPAPGPRQGLPPVPGRPGAPSPSGGWSQPQSPQPPAPTPAAPAPTPAARNAAANSGLFNVDDAAMDRIFSDLGVKEKTGDVPKINVREAVQQIRTLADVPTPPKVEGVGRLSRVEEPPVEKAPGKINAIGKFLLDQQDLQRIGKLTQEDLSDTKVRVLTHEASDEINKLLEHIATQPGVVGSVIVGHDGILIANSLPKEMDPESIGILSLAIYVNTTNIIKKQPMKHNHLHQLVSKTQHGYVVVADFGGGILVTVSSSQETEKLIPLMRSITQLVAQT